MLSRSLITLALFVTTVISTASIPRWPALTSSFGPVVDLGYAAYAGNDTLSGSVFYGGIPYMKAPVGNLRFQPPQQLSETYNLFLGSSDVVDVRNWGPLCIQQPAVVGFGNEDCATLNIWTPPGVKSTAQLPVYVYIHGGGYYYNSAQGFPGNDWVANAKPGMVVVSIQYRLGLLGFLSGSVVRADRVSSSNNGLLDQRAALEWIQRHIASFGGDPTKVTIGGESSGGGSVVLHLTAYGGEKHPPFRAAVIESAGNDPFYTDDHTEQCFAAATKQVGCDSASNIMSCWRKATIGAIVSAVNNKPSTCKFMPVIDNDFIKGITTKELTAGRFSKVPILAGHTAQDGSIFVGKPADVIDDASVAAAIIKRYTGLSTASQAKMLQVYPAPSDSTPWTTNWERASYAFMETEFACWDYYIGNISGKDAFNFRWYAMDPNLIASRGAYVGAAHTSELFYLYMGTNSGPSATVAGPVFTAFNSTQAAVATQAVAWWSSFARTLDPNTYAAPLSPKWFKASQGLMGVDQGTNNTVTGSSMMDRDPNYTARCAFWRSVADEIRL
ncbi:carboxyesterase [Mycena floridula]|nr:carboxyesterase [Mycena floridula]